MKATKRKASSKQYYHNRCIVRPAKGISGGKLAQKKGKFLEISIKKS